MYIVYLCVIILKSPIALIFMALFAFTKMCSYICNPKNYSFLNLVENDNWVYDTSVYFAVHIFVPSE